MHPYVFKKPCVIMLYATAARLSPLRCRAAGTAFLNVAWVPALLLLTSCGMLSKSSGEGGAGGWGGRSSPQPDVQAADRSQAENLAVGEAPAADPAVVVPLKARVYEAMARMSRAEADGETQAVETALDEAMAIVRQLLQAEGAMDEPEVRELYRSVITTYEQYYGVSDSLMVEYGEIFTFREEMFATMNEMKEPLLEDVMLPELPPVVGAIALDQNRLVEQSIHFLVREPERHLYRWMSRSETYFGMIERILREEGAPDELKYLAMIESALNPRARSRVGAGGLWQFMPATGRAYGLQITHWVDERWDPEKSTRAAARYLRDLHGQFGDWHLALAAYNCGPGRVRSAVRRFEAGSDRKATFWDIYERLPRETRNYVPMFIATALVVSNPDAFELKPVAPGPRYDFDVVQVEGMLDLRAAADLAGTSVDMLRALNPEIRQWTTPPSSTPYRLRVPANHGARFRTAFAALPPQQRQGMSEYRVRRGDSLSRIARRYSTTVAALQAANGLSGTVIHEGQLLQVPVRYDSYAGADPVTREDVVQDPPVRHVSHTTAGPASAEARPPRSSGTTRVHYRVRRGDNLTAIARKYGVSVSDLKAWNGLRGDRIRSGQTLKLYTSDASPAPAAERRASTTYRVRRGDNLTTIAARHGVSVGELRAWNGLSGDHIRPGQRLTIQGESRTGGSGRSGWVPHYVKRGENLTEIARRYGASVADVKKWNDLRGDDIRVGQRLAIYVR